MYTLEQLQKKSLKELKEIGWELNVLPADDRRFRENWINAIAGANPPLLQLLEVSPAAIVEQVQPIIETVEASPAAQDVQAQEPPLESKFGRIVYPRPAQEIVKKSAFTPLTECFNCEDGFVIDRSGDLVECPLCDGSRWKEISEGDRTGAEDSPGVEVEEAQEAIVPVAETSPGVEVDRALNYKFLLCLKEEHNTLWYDGKNFVSEKWSAKTYCKRGIRSAKHQLRCHPEVKRLGNLQIVDNSPADQKAIEFQAQDAIVQVAKNSPGVEVNPRQEAIVPAVKNLPGSRSTSTAHQLLELFKSSAHIIEDSGVEVGSVEDVVPECTECFGDGYVEDEFGLIKFCQCESEPKLSRQNAQRAIVPAAKLSLNAASDLNPILPTGLALSDRFLARYSPPQPENIRFQLEADGQLSLLDFEIESQPEPPDPDDFGSIDAFQEALARWDAENAEMLAVSMDSMCEWAPCPEEWYEPEAENLPSKPSSMIELPEQSEVMELSIGGGSFNTCNFSIPTFGAWCDRQTGKDEPPDTGIFARLPGPKPPKFPPRASQPKSAQVRQAASRNYPETIPKLSRVAAGSSTQLARSPPGGDA